MQDTRPLNHQDLCWAVKRMPRALLALLKKNPGNLFVAGGYIRSRITGEEVNDIDLFGGSQEFARSVALEYAEGDEKRVHETGNAYSVKGSRPMVQVIHRWTFDKPEACLESFDFTIACAAIWWNGHSWESACHPEYYADLAARRLVYLCPSRNEDAGGSILRVLKFYQRGYRIPLDSLGSVIARLLSGVHDEARLFWDGENSGPSVDVEVYRAKILTGLLREVDPNSDPDHSAHLPSAQGLTEEEINALPF